MRLSLCIRYFFAVLCGIVLCLTPSACSSSPAPGKKAGNYAAVFTRRDSFKGSVRVIINGKRTGSLGTGARKEFSLQAGRYTAAFEYKGMMSQQVVFDLSYGRVEYDVWVFENTRPNVIRRY